MSYTKLEVKNMARHPVVTASVLINLLLFLSIDIYHPAQGFSPAATLATQRFSVSALQHSSLQTTASEASAEVIALPDQSEAETKSGAEAACHSVRAPLKFIGPYPAMGLRFPELATPSQQARNISGISLDFVMDTAANTNTINGQVAQELGLEIVGEALPGLGAGGAINGGHTYMVGDCELEGLAVNEEDPFIFMQNLTASALPVASPAAAGLLSLAFFYCFEGGVEFKWQDETVNGGPPPSVTFYGESIESANILRTMVKVAVKELPVTRLPSININVNGVTIPALLDTGSPITVLNAPAAEQAGVTMVDVLNGKKKVKSGNPFSGLMNGFHQAQATAQAAARGDILTIAGSTGERVDLLKSSEKVAVEVHGSEGAESVDFGTSHVYVGNLPGLAALNALGDDSPPAAVLGMDVLRLRPKMLLKARNNEVYF